MLIWSRILAVSIELLYKKKYKVNLKYIENSKRYTNYHICSVSVFIRFPHFQDYGNSGKTGISNPENCENT